MDVKRFYAYVVSIELGRKEIKKLIDDTEKAEKENKWYLKDITVELTGVLFRRRMQFENIGGIKLENDQLKISYSECSYHAISAEFYKKDTTISIPIGIISTIKVEIH